MKSKFSKTLCLIVLAGVFGFVLNLLFADRFIAHMSTWHWVQKYHLVSPRAPLVINRTEEVRVNDGSDGIAAVNKTKSKVVAVVDTSSGFAVLKGAAVAVTSDGAFLTSAATVDGVKQGGLAVVASDGKRYAVASVVTDPMSGTAVLRAPVSFPAASFASDEDARVGSRVLLLGALTDGSPYVLFSFLSGGLTRSSGVVSSDSYTTSLGFQQVDGSMPGQVAINFDGVVVGMWDGQRLIPFPVLQNVVSGFLAHNGTFAHQVYGFNYRTLDRADATLIGAAEPGLLVAKAPEAKYAVIPGSPAAKAGLLEGDIITAIDGQASLEGHVDTRLQSVRGQAKFSVLRSGKQLTIQITPEKR